ncbi:MAG TPA: AGE family epimerase/isomerase [Bryobacteraceae bacterium]|nr:AGE family epimerase/isomerase [Bryobacteraceae bacterium]
MSRRSLLAATGVLAATPLDAETGFPAGELRKLYHRDLFEDFLPFMDRYAIDPDYGGFLCDTDFNGSRIDTYKSPTYEGRGIWVYSFLYTHFGRDQRYLDIARCSVALLRKSQPADDVFWCTRLNRDGTPSAPPAPSMPGDLAVCEGLAAYAQASGSQEHLDLARRLLHKCVEAYDRPDYNPGAGRTFLGANAPPTPGARNVGSWMLLLRCAAQIQEAGSDPKLAALIDRVIEAVMERHFNPAFRLNNEILPHDLSRPKGDFAELVYPGHTFEITWMLLEEAAARRDSALFQTAAERFLRHAEVAWDAVYGGVFHNLQNVDENRWVLNKVLWAQEEVLINALLLFEHTRSEWSRELFQRMNTYVRTNYPLKAHGSPLWMYATGRRATFESFAAMPKRVENYHHPRHLMLNLLRLNRMAPDQKK